MKRRCIACDDFNSDELSSYCLSCQGTDWYMRTHSNKEQLGSCDNAHWAHYEHESNHPCVNWKPIDWAAAIDDVDWIDETITLLDMDVLRAFSIPPAIMGEEKAYRSPWRDWISSRWWWDDDDRFYDLMARLDESPESRRDAYERQLMATFLGVS